MQDHSEIALVLTGCVVDATKLAWRFDAIEVRSLDSEAWMLDRCDEAGVEV